LAFAGTDTPCSAKKTGVIHVPLNLEDKKSIVAEVSAIAAEAHSVVMK